MTEEMDNPSSHWGWIARSALISALLVSLSFWVGMTWAQNGKSKDALFTGVNRIELFLARPTDIRNLDASKVPVKVYRMYALDQYMREKVLPKVPKGATNQEIQKNISDYIEAHRAQIDAETKDLKEMESVGRELSFRHHLMEYPAFVINGSAVFDHTNDLNEALRAFQQFYRGR